MSRYCLKYVDVHVLKSHKYFFKYWTLINISQILNFKCCWPVDLRVLVPIFAAFVKALEWSIFFDFFDCSNFGLLSFLSILHGNLEFRDFWRLPPNSFDFQSNKLSCILVRLLRIVLISLAFSAILQVFWCTFLLF